MDNIAENSLAIFQLAFLNAISENDDPSVIKKILRDDSRLHEFQRYIDEMDNKMIAVCAELARKYGRCAVGQSRNLNSE